MEKEKDFLERIRDYFQLHPNQFGWILIILGGVLLWGAIQKWEWLFIGDGRVFNIAWFREQFGDKAAQVVMGLLAGLCLVAGVIWLFAFKK